MERASLAAVSAAHAGRADLHGHDLRPGRGALPSIIPPEHADIISGDVEARAGVLLSELLQLSFARCFAPPNFLRRKGPSQRAMVAGSRIWAALQNTILASVGLSSPQNLVYRYQ